jgi:hypothetical protein
MTNALADIPVPSTVPMVTHEIMLKKLGEGLNVVKEVEKWNGKVEQQPR